MEKFYVNQILDINLDTEIADLSSAQDPVVYAISPDEKEFFWPAQVIESVLHYKTSKTDLYIAGDWRLQPMPRVPGAEAPGETVILTIYRLGQ